MIGIRSAFSIRARGQWPHLEAVYMTAPRSLAEAPRKSLPRGGRPYMTAEGRSSFRPIQPHRIIDQQLALQLPRSCDLRELIARSEDMAMRVHRSSPASRTSFQILPSVAAQSLRFTVARMRSASTRQSVLRAKAS